MRILLITDSHVSERSPECVRNWLAAARLAEAEQVDLTIHLGDITLDGDRNAGELPFAAALVGHWPGPIRCVPGNHDMGTGCGEQDLSREKLARYLGHFGDDRWWIDADGWALIGLNAQLLGTGTPEEAAQYEWLEDRASRLNAATRAALFVHRPLRRFDTDRNMPSGRYAPRIAAKRLLEGPLRDTLKVVFTGHTHQSLDFTSNGVRHIWVPSCSFVMGDSLQAPVGEKVIGVGWLELDRRGMTYAVRKPPGAEENELTRLACYADLLKH